MSLFYGSSRKTFKKFYLLRYYVSMSSESVSNSIYPPILDPSPKAKSEREELATHEKIKVLNTVEEKLLALNVPRFYGWESVIFKEGQVPYNFLPLVKATTKTKVHQIDKPCVEISLTQEKLKQVIDSITVKLEKILVYHSNYQKHSHEHANRKTLITNAEAEKIQADNIVEQINRVIVSTLSKEHPHLLKAQVDYKPRIEAFWNAGGLGLTQQEREKRKKKKVPDELVEEPSNKWIQYFGSPVVQLRSNLPLAPVTGITPTQTSECEDFPYDPVLTYALDTKRLHGATVPGFWPDDKHKYGLISLHSRPLVCNPDDLEESVHAAAILSSFSWLLGQASYHGFTTFNDLTYPLVTQTVMCNGQLLSLYTYQMNTCVTFADYGKRNECYTSGTMELYASIEDNQIKGWNEAALTHLLSMYVNKPKKRDGVNMTPYLNPEESLVQHIEYEKKRVWLYNTYRYFTSHRNRYLQPPEIFDWEYIYKVAFETRPLEARKRFFERNEDPLEERRMGEPKKYVRKADRSEADKKKKYEEQFYPDV